MTASCAPRTARGFRPEKRFSWRLVGLLLVTLVLLLSLNSDACGEPPKFETMSVQGPTKKYYEAGETVFYQCHPGYMTVSSVESYCEQNHSWFPIQEACEKKACEDPVLENGEVYAPNNSYEFENEAHFYCDEGYYLSGKQAILCDRRGDDVFWGDEFPKCNKIYCKSPGTIRNGNHTNSHRNMFEYNELITYTCNPSKGPEEFSLVGDSKLICIENNKWSSRPPECKVVKCDYPIVEHGKLISGIRNKYSYQATVLFECLPGFYLNGSSTVFCGGRSTWEPAMPTCVRGFKPIHPTKPPLSKYPGYPEPNDQLSLEDFEELVVGLAVLCTCLYRCFQRKKGVSEQSETCMRDQIRCKLPHNIREPAYS